MAVHCKDFVCSGICNVVGHFMELHMFQNQFLQGLFRDFQRKEQVIPVFYAFPYQVIVLKPGFLNCR